jgi:multidrug efflux pump subunit AcrA (membrane-fusion protein)
MCQFLRSRLAAGAGLRKHRLMMDWTRYLVTGVLATAVFGIAGGLAPCPESAALQPSEPPDRAVTITPAKSVCFTNTIQVTGVLVPRKEALVRPDQEGLQITQIPVQPGESVRSGQVLARLALPEGQPGGTVDVTAPVAGTIVFSSAVIGAVVSPRGMPLFQIAERGEMELLAETPATTMTRIAPNQSARIEVIGVGELPGKIRQVSSAINPTTQLGQLRLTIRNDARLRVGTFGRAIIDLGQRCGPAVPLSAVLYEAGGAIVQVVRDNRVESRRVSVGIIAGARAEIREGVAEGEMVIAKSGAFVRDGDRVHTVVEASAPK